jgi:hypothetical protein
MFIVNLTPHTINIVQENGEIRTFVSNGIARVSSVSEPVGDTGGDNPVILNRVQFGNVQGLPEYAPGVLYIVSAMVRAAKPSRTDLASPGDLVRDDAGNVIGCRNLIVN